MCREASYSDLDIWTSALWHLALSCPISSNLGAWRCFPTLGTIASARGKASPVRGVVGEVLERMGVRAVQAQGASPCLRAMGGLSVWTTGAGEDRNRKVWKSWFEWGN